jgi:type II secretory pathway component PulJ
MSRKKRLDIEHLRFSVAGGAARAAGVPDAGASFIELMLVLALFGTLTAMALALVSQAYLGMQSRLVNATLFDTGGTALNQMTREIRMAGFPSSKCFSTSTVQASPGLVASQPFVTVTAYDLVFQADIDGSGTVQQIEYVNPLNSQNLFRNSTKINLNGSLATTTLTTLAANNVQNQAQNQPLFTWDVDPSSTQTFPLNVRTIYINLVLQSTQSGSTFLDAVTLMSTCRRMNF